MHLFRRHKYGVILAACSVVFMASPCTAQNLALDETMQPVVKLVESYCVECHSGTDKAADLNLEAFELSATQTNHDRDTALWEKIVRRLRARQMPPADATRPDETEYQQSLNALESILDQAATVLPRPGHTEAIRRLNRTEYRNAIRDLLAFDVDVDAMFPADESGHGFDNVTVGEMPPVLLSRYISAAEQISHLAVGSSLRGPTGIAFRVPPDRTQESHVEGLPLGTRGGTVFDYQFPTAGEYEIQLRLTRDRDEHLEGLNGPHDIDVLIDRDLLHRFRVAPNKVKSSRPEYERDDSLIDANLKFRFSIAAGTHSVGVTFPQKSTSLVEMHRQPFDASFNRHRHPRRSPAIFEVSIVGPLDLQPAVADKADSQNEPKPQSSKTRTATEKLANETPSRNQIFSEWPNSSNDARPCAENILRRLMRMAYRRPVTDEDLSVPMRFFDQEYSANGFEAGIESALSAVLVNPYFLFRAESPPSEMKSGSAYRVSDMELASRLSFFLWSSIPDETLLDLAAEDRLHEPAVLDAQVLRMLGDDRAQSLVTNFAAQWLYLRNLESFRPDLRMFPDFDDNLRIAMRLETENLFQFIMREDRSVLELIDTDTTFLNERLAQHYGIPHVIGSQFRPVKLTAADNHRGGLLRHASILAVTSYATRTAPTIRGNWILGNILGTPPPPPPPNIPSLKDKTETASLSIRERLAEHRANPACASCHNLMDPIGFSLENFDAIGRWRLFDEGQPIDAAGGLPDGQPIHDFAELESSILRRPEMFVGTMTEKLLTFALGRGVGYYDAPAVRKIVRDAAKNDFRFSSVIRGIVLSVPFQMREME